MIDIFLMKLNENDVYPLVKAFYPEEKIKIWNDYDSDNRMESNPERQVTNSVDTTEYEDNQGIRIYFMIEEVTTIIYKSRLQGTITVSESNKEEKDKIQYKNSMKRLLYQLLSAVTRKELPWGILTGIRPTKLVYEMIEKGWDNETIRNFMKEEYLCSASKIEISIQIACRELELLNHMNYSKGYSLYIGIPFCPSTCSYCSFTSYSISKFSHYVTEYLQALEKEMKYAATCFPDKKLTTVYLGGGTPTTLTAEQLDYLLSAIKQNFDFSNVKEFCVEAGRPDSITRNKLIVLKKWGVDRISINPQSMQQHTLDLIGRKHTVEQIQEAFHMAREVGHDNINMDIIIGLPEENKEDVKNTLRQIKALNPDSLTVHTLAIKRAARLNIEKEVQENKEEAEVSLMLELAIEYANENNYIPYYLYRQKNMADNLENIGYSRYGKEGLYNILIMEEKQTILALGAGALSKFVFHEGNRIERVDNVKSVTDYINRIDEMIQRKKDFIQVNYHLL